MRHISIREFNKNVSASFKDLPFIVTSHGKPIAKVIEPLGVPTPTIQTKTKRDIIVEDPAKVRIVKKTPKPKVIKYKDELPTFEGVCDHGAGKGNCKKDKKCKHYMFK